MATIITVYEEYTIFYVVSDDIYIVEDPAGDFIGWSDDLAEAIDLVDGAEYIFNEWDSPEWMF